MKCANCQFEASRSMPVCALRHKTGQGWSDCCAIGAAPEGNAVNAVGAGAQLPQPEPVQPERSPAHYLWAVLSARIYEVFPLVCPLCGGPMRLIAFISQGAQVGKILDHIGVDSQPPYPYPYPYTCSAPHLLAPAPSHRSPYCARPPPI